MKSLGRNKVYVYFVDYDESYIEELLSGFNNSSNYIISTFNSTFKFFNNYYEKLKKKNGIHIVFLSPTFELDKKGNPIDVNKIIRQIKKLDLDTEIILYSEDDDINTISEAFNNGVYTFIKKNENILLRIENNIVSIISEKHFIHKKRSSKFYTILFLVLTVLLAIIFFFFPADI